MKEIVALRPKMYSYLMKNECVDKKTKVKKRCLIIWKIKYQDYKEFQQNTNKIEATSKALELNAYCIYRSNQQDCTQWR